MRIRAGFVSNSSSTSFLIITKRDLNKKDFFELMGVKPGSAMADLFDQFYQDVVDSADDVVDFKLTGRRGAVEDFFDQRRASLSPRMLEKLKDAQRRGLKAYYGWLSSDNNNTQTFFCTDSFEVENEKIYFNGLECVW